MRVKRERFFACSGDRFKKVYSPSVRSDGSMTIKETGKIDLHEQIQSYAESCDINVILARVQNGEFGLLNQVNGTYGDFTKAPASFAEALQLQMDSNRLFASLPVDIRDKFDQDPNKFFAAAGTDEWFEICSSVFPEQMRSIHNTSPTSPAEISPSADSTESS